MPIYDLNALYCEPEVNQISGFVDVAGKLDIDALVSAYANLVERAPKRSLNKKQYFQADHDGFPTGDENSNRREEHLALALFNQSHLFDFPGGRDLNIIDYQTPLKSKRDDKGIGKIDLFGVIDSSIPAVIELKIDGIKRRAADTPLRALLEGLAYCAIVEANIADITDEAQSKFNLLFTCTRPDLIVMAPSDYWHSYLNKPSAGDWLPMLETMVSEVRQKLHINIHLCSLLNADFEMGSSQKRPILKNQSHLVPVAPEMAL